MSGIKSKLWEELKKFLIDQRDEDPYLSSLQLKRKELETLTKIYQNLQLFDWLQRKGFDMRDQKLHNSIMKILNLQE